MGDTRTIGIPAVVSGAKLSCPQAVTGFIGFLNPAPDFVSTHDVSLKGHNQSVASVADHVVGENIFPFPLGCKLLCNKACVPQPINMSPTRGPWSNVHHGKDGGADLLIQGSYFICATGLTPVVIDSPGQYSIKLDQPNIYGHLDGGISLGFSPVNGRKLDGSYNFWGWGRDGYGVEEYTETGTRKFMGISGWNDLRTNGFEMNPFTNFVTTRANMGGGEFEFLNDEYSFFSWNQNNENSNSRLDFWGYETNGGYGFAVDHEGGEGNINAGGIIYLGRHQYNANYGNVDVAGQTFAGGTLEAVAELNMNPLAGSFTAKGGVEGFVGVKSEHEVVYSPVSFLSVAVHGGVSAGAGATATAEAGFDDGKAEAGFDIGATLGLGAEVGVNVQLDVVEMVDVVEETIGGDNQDHTIYASP